MAHPRKNDLAVKELRQAVTRLARQHHNPSQDDLAYWARAEHDLRVTGETVRKALRGELDPSGCNVEVLFLLAGYFGVGVDGLGPCAEARMRPIVSLVGHLGTPPGQGIAGTGWSSQTPALAS